MMDMLKNEYKGRFIVFEGLDGSGQTTQVELLKDFLVEKGFDVVVTKEPTMDSDAGREIRKVLDKEISADATELQELFARDRREHLDKVIIPALEEGKAVISDRYFFSSFAFGSAAGADLEHLIKINNGFLVPDVTVLLKVRPEVCVERIASRGEKVTLFEKKEKLEKVWQFYKDFPGRFENVFIVDGEKSVESVFEDVKKLITDKLNL